MDGDATVLLLFKGWVQIIGCTKLGCVCETLHILLKAEEETEKTVRTQPVRERLGGIKGAVHRREDSAHKSPFIIK